MNLIECDVYDFTGEYGGGHYYIPSGMDMSKLTLDQVGEKIGTYTFDEQFLNDIIGEVTRNGIRFWENTWQE